MHTNNCTAMKHPMRLLLFTLLALSACRKELELDPDTYYGVKELLRSANLQAQCGEPADAEGARVGVRGRTPEDYREPNGYRFFLLDIDNDDCRMEVQLDTVASSAVFAKLAASNGRPVRIRGVLKGYDQPGNLRCKRGHLLLVEQAGDVEVE
jgi:hypothetical protein